MKFDFLRPAIVAAVGILAVASSSSAQENFPSKPITILVGFSAGSSTDVASRLLADSMGEILGERVLVENRPGAASNVATQTVAEADADGYTLLMGTVANTINTGLKRDVSFDFPGDFTPVSTVGAVPMILVARADLGVSTIEELLAKMKESDDPLLYGSAGVGTAPHLSAELFASSTGTQVTHVPYKGSGDAVRDLAAGRIDFVFAPQSSALSAISEGSIVPLASSLLKRSSKLPDTPTVDETAVKGFDTSVWFGLVAPVGTPEPVIAKLNDAVQKALASEVVSKGFANSGIEKLGGTPAELSEYINTEVSNWAKVAEDANITVE